MPPSISTTVANTILIGLFGTATGTTMTAATGMTERWDAAGTGGGYLRKTYRREDGAWVEPTDVDLSNADGVRSAHGRPR